MTAHPKMRSRAALPAAALVMLVLGYAAIAALGGGANSRLIGPVAIGATAPEWMTGIFAPLALESSASTRSSLVLYGALVALFVLYVMVVRRARGLTLAAIGHAVLLSHVVMMLAPPLLSTDAFSYLSYSHLLAEGENPYTTSPADLANEELVSFNGNPDAVSVYGPLFSLLTWPLGYLSVPVGFWTWKVVVALASLAVALLVGLLASRRGLDPRPPVALVGLNPQVVVHGVGGAHNEAIMVALTLGGLLLWSNGRAVSGVSIGVVAAAIKLPAMLVVPFLVAAREQTDSVPYAVAAARRALAAAATLILIALAFALVFRVGGFDAGAVLAGKQQEVSIFSFPNLATHAVTVALPVEEAAARAGTRVAFLGLFAIFALAQLIRTTRGADPIAAAGWATLGALVATSWLLPWYAIWLLPLAAVAASSRLRVASLAMSFWLLHVSLPDIP